MHLDYYVYIIFRPNGVPCYVGKGRGRRLEHHAKFSHNVHLKSIYKLSGGVLPYQKMVENISDEKACEIERYFISSIGRADLGDGPLVNLCEGGEGRGGRIVKDSTRKKLSKALKGRAFTQEHLENMSKARLGKKRSKESTEKQRNTMTGRKRPDHSAKMKGRKCPWVRERLLGVKNPEHSERMKGNKFGLGKNMGRENQKPRKLSEDQVREIRDRAKSGEAHAEIAKSYGIHKSQISLIHTRRTWAWLD